MRNALFAERDVSVLRDPPSVCPSLPRLLSSRVVSAPPTTSAPGSPPTAGGSDADAPCCPLQVRLDEQYDSLMRQLRNHRNALTDAETALVTQPLSAPEDAVELREQVAKQKVREASRVE